MANKEHLAILKQGVEVWNEWRNKNLQIRVDLSKADLVKADLKYARLWDADLREANLTQADLTYANLERANLRRTNLKEASLFSTFLMEIQAFGTNFENAILTGAFIEDWQINNSTNLNNVICDYIHLKFPENFIFEELTPANCERRPHDPNKNFAPGEFTKLYQEVKNTIELVFNHGINWKAFAHAFKETNIQVYDTERGELFFRGYKALGDGLIVLKVSVPPGANQEKIRNDIIHKYELQIAKLEGELKAKNEMLAPLYERLLLPGIQIDKFEGKLMTGDRTINMGSGNYNEKIDGNYVQGNYYAAAHKQSLAEAATEIQQLLEQLSKTYPTNTKPEKMVVAAKAVEEIENNPTLSHRILSALKAGSISALEQALNHPAASFVISALDDWQQTKNH
ncbi:MAG: pentapeptide repeat-containing protein [Hydrococcus sp. Prado102]|nr:pentapeptide repeat-containing protein [Hydrococcus sp. Prado102]